MARMVQKTSWAHNLGICNSRVINRSSVTIIGLIFLTACQSEQRPIVTLADAKIVSAEFQGIAYKPPPRTVTDITVLLDEHRQTNRRQIENDLKMANSKPPTTSNQQELATYFRDRAKAAMFVGRYSQSRRDLEKTLKIVEGADTGSWNNPALKKYEIYADLAHTEQFSGSMSKGLKYSLKRLEAQIQSRVSNSPSTYAVIAMTEASLGNLSSSEHNIEIAERYFREIENLPPSASALMDAARGRIHDVSGRIAEAEIVFPAWDRYYPTRQAERKRSEH